MTNEIELGRITPYRYCLVQMVQVRHAESGEIIDTIDYAAWPDRIEAQLLRAQQRVAELERALAEREALSAIARTLRDETEATSHSNDLLPTPAVVRPLLTDDPPCMPPDPDIAVSLPIDAPAPAARPFYCAQCDMDFSTRKYPKAAIKRHLTVHPAHTKATTANERPYYCAECEKDFSGHKNPHMAILGHLSNSRAHKVRKGTASEPESPPTEEDRATVQTVSFPDDPELSQRMRGNWPRPCPECWVVGREKDLKGPLELKAHLAEVHGAGLAGYDHVRERPIVVPNAHAPEPTRAPAPTPVACVACRRTFDSPQALDRHSCHPIAMPRVITAPPPVQSVPRRQPFGKPLPIVAANGWACAICQSGTFGPSVKDPTRCQRCVALDATTASEPLRSPLVAGE